MAAPRRITLHSVLGQVQLMIKDAMAPALGLDDGLDGVIGLA